MGEFGAVAVVSGHIRGLTTTMPLHVEILYNEYDLTGAFAVASLLMLLALFTMIAKSTIEHYGLTRARRLPHIPRQIERTALCFARPASPADSLSSRRCS